MADSGWRMVRSAVLALALCAKAFAAHANDPAQLVLVRTADWEATSGTLATYERTDGQWRPVASSVPVTIGRSGSAWGIGLHEPQPGPVKREGDGRSPAGMFRIGIAFGYAASMKTSLEYRGMNDGDYCIDVDGSPLYNRIVNERTVGADAIAGSTEPMRRDVHAKGDQRYKLGFVIEHNADAQRGGGSCIFAHLWRAPTETTAGCTAMDEPVMRQLLGWLDAKRNPVFVLLPEAEYRRLRPAWHLP